MSERTRLTGTIATMERWLKGNEGALRRHRESAVALPALEAELAYAQGDMAARGKEVEVATDVYRKADHVLSKGACPECKRPWHDFDMAAATADREAKRKALQQAKDGLDEADLKKINRAAMLAKAKAFHNPSLTDAWRRVRKELAADKAALSGLPEPVLGEATARQLLDAAQSDLEEAVRLTERRAAAAVAAEKAARLYAQFEQEARIEEEGAARCPPPSPGAGECEHDFTLACNAEAAAVREAGEARDAMNLAAWDLSVRQSGLAEGRLSVERIRAARGEAAGLEWLQKYLRNSRARLSAEVWDGLLDYATHLAAQAAPDPMGRLGRSAKGEFMAGGVPVSDFGGAMQSVVGLALRLSMARVFYGGGLVQLLDECTDSCDNATAAAMAGMLLGTGNQVINVTHRDDAVMGEIICLG
jgi:hypothetical protein